jgi:hypothetical protein
LNSGAESARGSILGPYSSVESVRNAQFIAAPTGKLNKFELDYRELENMKQIGKGSYGVVYQ